MVEHMMGKVLGDLYGFMPFHCRRLHKVCRASAQGLGSKPQERLTGLQRGRRSMLGEAPHNNKGAQETGTEETGSLVRNIMR
jgi:hypothetical protein